MPKAFVYDGLPTYDEAYRKELFSLQNPRVQNVRSVSIRYEGLNANVERGFGHGSASKVGKRSGNWRT